MKSWIEAAAKHHGAVSVPQVVMLVDSFGTLRSEAAAFELIRLMKQDRYTYGSCFYTQLDTVREFQEAHEMTEAEASALSGPPNYPKIPVKPLPETP